MPATHGARTMAAAVNAESKLAAAAVCRRVVAAVAELAATSSVWELCRGVHRGKSYHLILKKIAGATLD